MLLPNTDCSSSMAFSHVVRASEAITLVTIAAIVNNFGYMCQGTFALPRLHITVTLCS